MSEREEKEYPIICECGYEYFRVTNPNGRYDFYFTCERCAKQYNACGAVQIQSLCKKDYAKYGYMIH